MSANQSGHSVYSMAGRARIDVKRRKSVNVDYHYILVTNEIVPENKP
jgi:hypothetical protein